jgi:hypothetical protein
LFLFLSLPLPTQSIKFALLAHRYPLPKCIWNTAHLNALVVVTAHVSPAAYQRVDIEIIDSSSERRVYLSKKDIKGETRLAVTSHAEGEVGVCFRNYLDHGAVHLTPLSNEKYSLFIGYRCAGGRCDNGKQDHRFGYRHRCRCC